jgi:DNA-binding response OmpR family regulator
VESVPDLVVTDMMMPVMGGDELIRRLRCEPATAGIPILAASGDTHLAAGADAVIPKPYRPENLIEVADELQRCVTRQRQAMMIARVPPSALPDLHPGLRLAGPARPLTGVGKRGTAGAYRSGTQYADSIAALAPFHTRVVGPR